MQTRLAAEFAGTREGAEAEAIVRRCVHCGFCTATCPTYQLLGDELDGPRGRIVLIQQVLEGAAPSRKTQLHLDRCLTCRNCETTCPSGVAFGRLVEIARPIVDAKVPRAPGDRARRWALKEGLPSPVFAPALAVGRALRPLLPATVRAHVPAADADAAVRRRGKHAPSRAGPPPPTRRALLLRGCVQPALRPAIDRATERVLAAAGIATVVADRAGCCGALRTHLGDVDGGLADMRRNVDAWSAAIDSAAAPAPPSVDAKRPAPPPIDAIVVNASGCGAVVKDYGRALAHDAAYADRAARIAAMVRDPAELLPDLVAALRGRVRPPAHAARLAFHPPCTLQHAQRLRQIVEPHLAALDFDVVLPAESHLCCGSAGTYSVLQPEIATALRDRKLGHLAATAAPTIVSANVGCIQHLQSGTTTPVRHWIEVLADALDPLEETT